MPESPKKDESTANDADTTQNESVPTQNESVSNIDECDSDTSGPTDAITCESTIFKVIDEEGAEEETDEVNTQKESIKINDVDVAQTTKDVKNTPDKAQTTNAGKKAKKKKAKKRAPTEGKDNVSSDTPPAVSGHPCKQLLDNYEPREYDLMKLKKYKVVPMARAPCLWVDTVEFLEELIEQLMSEKEIGLYVRYNANHYKNRLCLMLISTRDSNYMIDCIKLEKHLPLLNPVFLSPDIIKVMDSVRVLRKLQLDYNIWFVNIFDVALALRRTNLNISYFRYVENVYHVKWNHTVLLTNWQMRPLSEMFRKMALLQMHYLIPLYIDMKNRLIDAKLIKPFLDICNKECGYVFRPIGGVEDCVPDVEYMPPDQVAALCKLHEWRHRVAKLKNRSVSTVLHNKQIHALARDMVTSVTDILRLANTPCASNNVNEIQKIIKSCKNVIGPVNMRQGPEEVKKRNTLADIEGYKQPKRTKEDKLAAKTAKKKQKLLHSEDSNSGTSKKQQEQTKSPKGFQFGCRPEGPFKNKNRDNNLDDRFRRRRSPDLDGPIIKRTRSRFTDRDNEPSSKRPRISPWVTHQPWSRDRSPPPARPLNTSDSSRSFTIVSNKEGSHKPWSRDRSPSPPHQLNTSDPSRSFMIVSNKGEAFPIENANILANLLRNVGTESVQRESRVGDCWQNNSQANSSVWDIANNQQSNNPLNSITALLNLSSTLMNLNRQSSLNDAMSRTTVHTDNESFIPNHNNRHLQQGNQKESIQFSEGLHMDTTFRPALSNYTSSRDYYTDSYSNPSQRDDVVSYPNWSQRDDVTSHPNPLQRDDVVPYPNRSQRDDIVSYPNQSQRDKVGSYPNQSQRDDVSYPNWSQRDDVVSYPNRSQRDDVSYPNQSQRDKVVSYPNRSQRDDVVSYPNQSQRDDVISHPNLLQRDDVVPYPNRSQRDDVSYPNWSQRDVSYPNRSQRENVMSYPNQSRGDDVISHPNPFQGDDVVPYPNWSQRDNVVSYANQVKRSDDDSYCKSQLSDEKLYHNSRRGDEDLHLNMSRRSDVTSYPNQPQGSDMVSYPDQSRSPNQSDDDLYHKSRRSDDDLYCKSRRIDKDLYNKSRKTDKDLYHKSRRTDEDLYHKSRRTGEDLYDKPRRTSEDLYDKPRRTGDGLHHKSRRAGDDLYHKSRRTDESPYRKSGRSNNDSYSKTSQRSDLMYPTQSQKSDVVSHASNSRSSAYPERSRNPDVVTYPMQSQRSDLVAYPNQLESVGVVSYPIRSQNAYTVSESDHSRKLDVVSYPKYNPSRYSRQGF